MAQGSPPPQPYWPPPTRGVGLQSSSAVLGVVVAVIVVAAFVAIFMASAASTLGFGIFPGLLFLPFCGVFVVILIIVVLGLAQGMNRPHIPPPPPIQQPMVPAGLQGSVALSCPNCGAPPQNVDRFGVATCPYCNTRFLVR